MNKERDPLQVIESFIKKELHMRRVVFGGKPEKLREKVDECNTALCAVDMLRHHIHGEAPVQEDLFGSALPAPEVPEWFQKYARHQEQK